MESIREREVFWILDHKMCYIPIKFIFSVFSSANTLLLKRLKGDLTRGCEWVTVCVVFCVGKFITGLHSLKFGSMLIRTEDCELDYELVWSITVRRIPPDSCECRGLNQSASFAGRRVWHWTGSDYTCVSIVHSSDNWGTFLFARLSKGAICLFLGHNDLKLHITHSSLCNRPRPALHFAITIDLQPTSSSLSSFPVPQTEIYCDLFYFLN